MQNVIDFQRREKVISLQLQFINMASHEFRSPLSTIVSSVNLLDKYQQKNDSLSAGKHIQRLKDTVTRMRNMLEYFTAMNADVPGSFYDRLPVEKFRQLILESVSEMEDGLKPGQKIRLVCKGSASVSINYYYLLAILRNLLSNAIRFSPEDQAIDVLVSVDETEIKLIVKDKGKGITPAEIAQIRKKYFDRTDLKQVPGSGLGLYIVAKYLTTLGGQIDIKSTLSKGSSFKITLPNRLT